MGIKKQLLAAVAVTFVSAFMISGASCEDEQDILAVSADGSKLSIHADEIPLQLLLARLAQTSALDIYVAPSLKKELVTVSFDDLPVEKGVAKLLKGFNFLASFKREKEIDRLAALKIYPKGTSKGQLVHVEAATEGNEEGKGWVGRGEFGEGWTGGGEDATGTPQPSDAFPVPQELTGEDGLPVMPNEFPDQGQYDQASPGVPDNWDSIAPSGPSTFTEDDQEADANGLGRIR